MRPVTLRREIADRCVRVRVSGIKGAPPPPTTKVTIFYHGGYQSQLILNATGYGTAQKWALFETQLRRKLKASGADKELSTFEFQVYVLLSSSGLAA